MIPPSQMPVTTDMTRDVTYVGRREGARSTVHRVEGGELGLVCSSPTAIWGKDLHLPNAVGLARCLIADALDGERAIYFCIMFAEGFLQHVSGDELRLTAADIARWCEENRHKDPF